jgi:hypothetical protein
MVSAGDAAANLYKIPNLPFDPFAAFKVHTLPAMTPPTPNLTKTPAMSQADIRDDLFKRSLTTYRCRIKRIAKVNRIGVATPNWHNQSLLQAQYEFNHQVALVKKYTGFTLGMQLAVWWVKTQAFWLRHTPDIKRGWQESGKGFQGGYSAYAETQPQNDELIP